MSQTSTPIQSHMSHSVNTLNPPSGHVSWAPPISRLQILYLHKNTWDCAFDKLQQLQRRPFSSFAAEVLNM